MNCQYWWINFCTGGAVLADQGADTNAQTTDKAYNDAQLWQLVGNEGSFYMKNKAGRYLSYSGGNFKTTTDANSKATLILHERAMPTSKRLVATRFSFREIAT